MILIVVLIVFAMILLVYFVLRYQQQAIQVFTIESFINTKTIQNDNQNKSLIDTINDFFEDDEGKNDDFNNGDSNGGGDDGGD